MGGSLHIQAVRFLPVIEHCPEYSSIVLVTPNVMEKYFVFASHASSAALAERSLVHLCVMNGLLAWHFTMMRLLPDPNPSNLTFYLMVHYSCFYNSTKVHGSAMSLLCIPVY